MVLQTAGTSLSPADAYNLIRSNAFGVKSQAQNALVTVQTTSISTLFVFQMLDQLSGIIAAFNTWKTTPGLDAYATAQDYTGSLVSDTAACVTAAQAVITWVVQNFPSSGGFLQAESLNANGSRNYATFAPSVTGGLQTALQAFIATIG